MPLLTDSQLESSAVVANCRMNRERDLSGTNGYDRELGFPPLAHLTARLGRGPQRWLDLCCGTGRALFQADACAPNELEIVGVDLVAAFWPGVPSARLQLVAASLHDWQPDRPFDLITCVHGLHYVGDKLGLVGRAVSWLTADGRFISNLDIENLRDESGAGLGRRGTRLLRAAGLEYNARRHLLACDGHKAIALPATYLGADDSAGPNYTGQPAVHSRYRLD